MYNLSSSYKKIVKRKLEFKGYKPKNAEKKKKLNTSNINVLQPQKLQSQKELESESEVKEVKDIKILNGSGLILTSKTTVHGFNTKFTEELNVNDAIIVNIKDYINKNNEIQIIDKNETKIIKMILSDTSLGISSSFSNDIKIKSEFQYVNVLPDLDVNTIKTKEINQTNKLIIDEEKALGTYASKNGTEIVYHERKKGSNATGGYKIIRKTIDSSSSSSSSSSSLSRELLLQKRTKAKSDRYCN